MAPREGSYEIIGGATYRGVVEWCENLLEGAGFEPHNRVSFVRRCYLSATTAELIPHLNIDWSE